MRGNIMGATRASAIGLCGLALAGILFGTSAPARADFIGSVSIGFTSGSDSGNYQIDLPQHLDYYQWALSAPVQIYSESDPGLLLATIHAFGVELDGDPGVSLGFFVTAGAAPTQMTITSSTVTFDPIFNPLAFATAAITVTDLNGNGASASGLFPGTAAYQAVYNGSTVFANLVSPVMAGADSSATGSERFPALGMTTIVGAVSSIQSQFDFMLSAFDSASGTSRFFVTPEPTGLALAGLGFVGAALFGVRCRRARRA
ncbi:MAG: hypothetical protein AB7O59_03420 [Pirellulales bacterium]